MSSLLRPAIAAAAVGVLSLTTACSGSSDGAVPLRVATITNSPTSLVQQVAIDRGFYDDHGVEVELVGVKDGPAGAALVTSGGAEIGDIAGPSIVTMAVGKAPVKFLADAEGTAFDVIGLASAKGEHFGAAYPENVLELAGSRIGVPSRGSTIEAAISAMLADAGLDPAKDVTWVATGGVQTTIAAMKNGQVEYTAWPSAITRTAFASSLEVYTVAAADAGTGGPLAAALLSGASVVLEKTADERGEELVDYCRALVDTVVWMQDPANEDDLGAIAQDWLGLPDLEQGVIAGRETGSTAIATLSKDQWDNNAALFTEIGSADYADVIFTPCFEA